MNNKELTSELAEHLGKTPKEVSQLIEATISVMKDEFAKGNSISFQGFGAFEIRKKEERITQNPMTKKRMLIPPKLALVFKPSTNMKDRIKQELPENE